MIPRPRRYPIRPIWPVAPLLDVATARQAQISALASFARHFAPASEMGVFLHQTLSAMRPHSGTTAAQDAARATQTPDAYHDTHQPAERPTA